VKNRELYEEPRGNQPPPWWIRGLLVLTCTGVSFAHGSNDGQKGMGLIMLILVGTVPMAYALNRAMPVDQMTQFVAVAQVTQAVAAQGTACARRPSRAGAVGLRAHQDVTPEWCRRWPRCTAASAAGQAARLAAPGAGGRGGQRAQRHVPRVGGDPLPREEADRRFDADTEANLKAFKQQIDARPSSSRCG
jgi:PiT family inorganic phosphate transporter